MNPQRLLDVLATPNDDVQQRLRILYEQADSHFERFRWRAAARALLEAYEALKASQPAGQRFHKGYPLHNLGVAHLLARNLAAPESQLSDWQAARRYTYLAFIEDALSAPLTPGAELGTPASSNLTSIFGATAGQLSVIAGASRDWALAHLGMLHDPQQIYERMAVDSAPDQGVPPISSERYPGQFASDWSRRVFVGGPYRTHIAELNIIASWCRQMDYDPVVVMEFAIPESKIHHHSLMLLHECRLAIFDVTTEAGQLMELERTRDYDITPLVVSQHGTPSQMVTDLNRLRLTPKQYNTHAELEAHVRDYLRSGETTLEDAN